MNNPLNIKISIFLLYTLFAVCQMHVVVLIDEDELSQSEDLSKFVQIGNNYYFIESQDELNWFEAANVCRRKGANLASIETEEENKAITDYIKTVDTKGNGYFWLSATDLAADGTFTWTGTGQLMKFTSWDSSEPNNVNNNEHCVHIVHSTKWNDMPCKGMSHYICEIPMKEQITVKSY